MAHAAAKNANQVAVRPFHALPRPPDKHTGVSKRFVTQDRAETLPLMLDQPFE